MSITSRLRTVTAIMVIAGTCAAAVAIFPHPASAQSSSAAASSTPTASDSATTPEAAGAAPATNIASDAPVGEGSTGPMKIDNPYGLDALWAAGDLVARGTLIILALMSMGSWYVIISKLIDQIRIGLQGRETRMFWRSSSVAVGNEGLTAGSPYRYITESALKATEHHEGVLLQQIDRNSWVAQAIQRSVDKVQSRLQGGLALLATVGSTGPFIGLFGTVWGIYHALTAIGIAGQASIDKVAGPVGEALIMTALGLAVAVPAVLGYNWLIRRNKGVMEDVRSFAADLHSVLLAGNMHVSQAAQDSVPVSKKEG